MRFSLVLIVFTFSLTAVTCQSNMESKDTLPYYQIPDYPETYSAGTVLSRLVDGLGFRYYWATKDLRPEDISYRPSEDAQSVEQTLAHLYGLSRTILHATTSTPIIRSSEKAILQYGGSPGHDPAKFLKLPVKIYSKQVMRKWHR